MVEKRGNKYCVVHGHPQKAGSKTDKPIGSIIKCYSFDPNKEGSEANAKRKANAMHKAIIASQQKQSIQSLKYSSVKLQAFSQNEIIARIPADILEKIKQKDEHPYFQMYSIIHEGLAMPKREGKGRTPILWGKEAIQSVANVIKNGIKFFNGHNSTNANQDKQELGEMIHSFSENIKGKLHHLVIGYFPPETREIAKDKDICSQESEWNIAQAFGNLIATTCDNITGIALESSKFNKPAFKDAKMLASVQAFDDENKDTTISSETDEDKIKGIVAKQDEYLRSKL